MRERETVRQRDRQIDKKSKREGGEEAEKGGERKREG